MEVMTKNTEGIMENTKSIDSFFKTAEEMKNKITIYYNNNFDVITSKSEMYDFVKLDEIKFYNSITNTDLSEADNCKITLKDKSIIILTISHINIEK